MKASLDIFEPQARFYSWLLQRNRIPMSHVVKTHLRGPASPPLGLFSCKSAGRISATGNTPCYATTTQASWLKEAFQRSVVGFWWARIAQSAHRVASDTYAFSDPFLLAPSCLTRSYNSTGAETYHGVAPYLATYSTYACKSSRSSVVSHGQIAGKI